MMKLIENELTIEIDVDDTLLMKKHYQGFPSVEILNPYTGLVETRWVHELHVKILKEHKSRGYYVTVWSAAGPKWVKAAVDALQLDAFVDVGRVKSLKFIDDLEAKDVLGQRLYFKPE